MPFFNKHNTKVTDFLSTPFPLLDDFKSKLFLVIFCGLFSAFFIFFYNPFNLLQINYDTAIGRLLSIWSAGIIGALILSFTQFFLRNKLKLNQFTTGQFLGWVFFEFTILCLGIFILFGESNESFWKELLPIIRYTVSLAIIPYTLACLVIAVIKLSEKVRQKEDTISNSTEQHLFKDENGKIMLALRPNQILLLKSENNYTSIFYIQNEKIERQLIRTNLKKLESELEKYPELMRIHRSYMINLQNMSSMQRKKGGYEIKMDQLPENPLKVSESYKEAFEAKIKK